VPPHFLLHVVLDNAIASREVDTIAPHPNADAVGDDLGGRRLGKKLQTRYAARTGYPEDGMIRSVGAKVAAGGASNLGSVRGSGEIGRRAGFRFLCCRACGFTSHLPHDWWRSGHTE